MSTHTPHPDLSPPITNVGVIGWLRTNLFSSWLNTILTLAAAFVVLATIPPLLEWAFIKADWVGDSREACTSGGACWVFVGVRFNQFMYGLYPEAEYWRINLAAVLIVALMIPLFIERFRWKLGLGLFILVGYPIIAFFLFSGGVFGLEYVETSRWGGLTLTLVLASVGMAASFPLGIVLALGRRSTMPVVRTICVVFIEFWRGVPLITVLFMASVMLPLFLPEGVTVNQLLRAVVGVALFSSAYMAEVVRGGLQAISKGQYEGASSLGLGYWQSMRLVIMPQALKIVIPGIVNTFIGLFKDTTLVLIIGLLDLLGMIQSAIADPNWSIRSVPYTGYAFVAIVFWIFCYSMSRYSRYLEDKLHTGHKR